MGEIRHVQNPVIEYAKANGWFVRRVQWIGRRGAPDTMMCKGGITLWVEFKDYGEQPEIHQVREHGRMRGAGLLVFVIDDVIDGKALLDRYDPDDI